MSEFTEDLKRLWRRLERLGPWGLAALLVGGALLGYYGLLGVRYIGASRHVDSLSAQVSQVSASVRQGRSEPTPVGTGASPEERLAEVSRSFTYAGTDEIVETVTSAASRAGLSITTLSVGEVQARVQDKVLYQAQPVSLRLDADATDVVRFLTRLRERAPSASVSDIRLSGLDASATAQVQLVFYLSPQPAPQKKPAPTPTASGTKATK